MTDTTTKTPVTEDVRTETAEAAPELAEHDRIGELLAEVEDLKQKALYAQAEVQNVRRRAEKEAADARTYAATSFARDLLSVADNLGRALASIPAEARGDERLKGLVTGIEMTAKELDTVFGRHGITKIEAVGQSLDPNRHQAIVEVDSDEHAAGTVATEMQTGYMIRDRLLRPAMVGVSRGGGAG